MGTAGETGAAQPLDGEARAEAHAEERGPLALAVELGHEVVELRANEIEGKTGARVVKVINRALLEEEAA
jgi:hypothetical protein